MQKLIVGVLSFCQLLGLSVTADAAGLSNARLAIDETTNSRRFSHQLACDWDCAARTKISADLKWNAKVIGDVDDRRLPSATSFTATEWEKYSSIARIECPTDNKEVATGTVFGLGSFSVVITAAHFVWDLTTKKKRDLSKCQIAYYNISNECIETVKIISSVSPWDNPVFYGDPSIDYAILTLAGEPATPQIISKWIVDFSIESPTEVRVIGFSGDFLPVSDQSRLRKSNGFAVRMPSGSFHYRRSYNGFNTLKNPENLAVVSYDSGKGLSGAPVFNKSGDIIGIHQGSAGEEKKLFDSKESYNLFIVFDKSFASMLKTIAK